MTNKAKLEISGLELDLTIGCYDYEKDIKQKISLDIIIEFRNLPQICLTDDLNDGFCYDRIIQLLAQYSQNHSHETIEKWCYKFFQLIKSNQAINNISTIEIKIKKKPLEIINLKNGIYFSYKGDL